MRNCAVNTGICMIEYDHPKKKYLGSQKDSWLHPAGQQNK